MGDLTPRELVYKTLRHEPTPRVPRNMWVLPWAQNHYGEEMAAIYRDFPEDFEHPKYTPPAFEKAHGDPFAIGECTDEWGCVFVNAQEGVIGEVKDPLIKDYDTDLDKLETPDEWFTLDLDEVNRFCEATDNFTWFSTPVRPFERMQFLRGTENLYLDIGFMDDGFMKMKDIIHEWNLKVMHHIAKSNVDGIQWLDDWGSQFSLLINPVMWREIFKPMYAEYAKIAHDAGKFTFMHSDGYIFDIYEDLIEIGVDAINSQLFCMDIEEIGKRFKGRITFWGEIDRQNIIPFGSVEDTKSAVKRVANALYDGNGGVIAQCEFGPGAKPENIRAVYEGWSEV